MKYLVLFSFLFFLCSCFAVEKIESNADPVDHETWDTLLKRYVDEKGFVDYKGFKEDSLEFTKYLTLLLENAPSANWTEKEKLAYWINAYNAFTIQLILNHSDENIKSIKDIGSKIKIPFVNTPWDVKFIVIGNKEMDLNNLEHGIIRKRFDEPRIHFALVCAALSCPSLRNEAYTANKLDAQLDDQAVIFINDDFKNNVRADRMELSKVFSWYGGDFKKHDSIANWVNKYAEEKAKSNVKIIFKDYDWRLNGTL